MVYSNKVIFIFSPVMPGNTDILYPDATYHIFNRANGNDQLFLSNGNYSFFLDKYRKYIYPIAETFCYCLMPNHFHFVVRVRSEKDLNGVCDSKKRKCSVKPSEGSEPSEGCPTPRWLSMQFGHLFNSYTQAFNKQQNRKGSLFKPKFKKKQVQSEKYLRKLIHYIHYNPVEAGLCKYPQDWIFSSYASIVSDRPTLLIRAEVLALFETIDNFTFCHEDPPEFTGIE